MFKEAHTGQHIEHCLFLHPVRKTQELSWGKAFFTVFLQFIVFNLNNSLGADRKVLTVKCLFILNYDKVIRAVMGRWHWFSVAVQELNWHVGSVLGKEADCLVTGLDSLNHVPAGRVLTDKVGLA